MKDSDLFKELERLSSLKGQKTRKEEDKQPEKITDISVHIAALSRTYRPAPTPAEATHFFSTAEVVDAIREIDPSAKVAPTEVFSALRNAGFDFCNRPGSQGLEFKWLFRER